MILTAKRRHSRALGGIIAFCATVLIMVYLSYLLPTLLPGDFVTAMYGSSQVPLTGEQENELRSYFSGDTGFGQYLKRLVTLKWGYSYAFMKPVSEVFFEALPWTVLLVGFANLIAMVMGFVLGVEAAWRTGSRLEKGAVGGMTFLEGIPEISTGVILLVVFAYHWQWFPASGAQSAYVTQGVFERIIDVGHHLTLPLATLVLAYLPGNFLVTRNSMMMVIKAGYVTTARAKGLAPIRIRYVHAARNALQVVVTRFGLRLAFMITGALVVERITAYPGLGTLLFDAIRVRDIPVIQAVVLFSSLLILAIVFGLDMVYRIIDPRIRHAR